MNEQERARAAMGVDVLNASLAGLGYPAIVASSDVRMAEPIVGDIPNAVVDSPGVAPLRIVFGRDLSIWVGESSRRLTWMRLNGPRCWAERRPERWQSSCDWMTSAEGTRQA